jgi:hypothetical protein
MIVPLVQSSNRIKLKIIIFEYIDSNDVEG